jgi:hypothetical protein
MKRLVVAVAAELFGLAPAIGSACEYSDAMASATLPAQLGLAPAPQASKAPATKMVKAPAQKAKQVVGNKAPARATKLVVVSTD